MLIFLLDSCVCFNPSLNLFPLCALLNFFLVISLLSVTLPAIVRLKHLFIDLKDVIQIFSCSVASSLVSTVLMISNLKLFSPYLFQDACKCLLSCSFNSNLLL